MTTLEEAASSFDHLGRRIELARCLVDKARAEITQGVDPSASLARARAELTECGAPLFLAEVDEAAALVAADHHER